MLARLGAALTDAALNTVKLAEALHERRLVDARAAWRDRRHWTPQHVHDCRIARPRRSRRHICTYAMSL